MAEYQVYHAFWQQRVDKEMMAKESFENVVDRLKMKRSKSNTPQPIMPFKTNNMGQRLFFDKSSKFPSNPCTINNLGVTRQCTPNYENLSDIRTNFDAQSGPASINNKKQEQSVSRKSSIGNNSIKSKNSSVSRNGIEGLIKRTKSMDTVIYLKKVDSKLKEFTDSEMNGSSERAKLVRELKAELENQSKAKNKALDILQKLKEQGQLLTN